MRPLPFSSRKLIAIAVGILLAGAPIAGLNFWVDGLLVRQSSNDAETFARRSIQLATMRLESALAKLDSLADRGVDGCRPDQIAALKEATLSDPWVKQYAVLGPAGQALCSDFGLTGVVKGLSSRKVQGTGAQIEVVQVGDQPAPLVRLVRPVGAANSLAALILPDVLIAKIGLKTSGREGYRQLALVDGTIITEIGARPSDSETLSAVTRNARVSDRFGLRVATSYPQIEGEISLDELREIAIAMTGILSRLWPSL